MAKRKTPHDPTEPAAERRSHDRFAIQGAVVEYMKVDLLAFMDRDLRRGEGLMNVSEGGMLFAAEDSFPVGQTLSLVLRVPEWRDPPKMRGEVVRCERPEGADWYHIGVRFTMCCSQAAAAFRSLVEQSERPSDRVQLYVSDAVPGAA